MSALSVVESFGFNKTKSFCSPSIRATAGKFTTRDEQSLDHWFKRRYTCSSIQVMWSVKVHGSISFQVFLVGLLNSNQCPGFGLLDLGPFLVDLTTCI